jgi:hypothetical protein
MTSLSARVKRRCARCRWTGLVPPRQRHCYQPRFGKGSYACWGDLLPLTQKARMTTKEAIAKMAEEGGQALRHRPQEAASRKLAHATRQSALAQKRLMALTAALAKTLVHIRKWERRATLYAKRASMTDAQVAADRAARLERAAQRRTRRGIRLGKDTL